MIRFYYTCPRCGRVWKRFLPRSFMRCKFCSQTWHTKGKKGTSKKLSWKAGVFWLFWIVLITACVWKFNLIVGATQEALGKILPAKPVATVEEDEDEFRDVIPPMEELPSPGINSSDDDFDPTFESDE